MFKKIKAILSILIFSLLLGCSQTISIDLSLNEKITLIRLEPESRGKIKKLTVKDDEYKELQEWLNNNKNGWEKIKIEIYPTHVMKSGKYLVGVAGDTVIIFHRIFEDSTLVYQKPLEPNELKLLNNGVFTYKDENKT